MRFTNIGKIILTVLSLSILGISGMNAQNTISRTKTKKQEQTKKSTVTKQGGQKQNTPKQKTNSTPKPQKTTPTKTTSNANANANKQNSLSPVSSPNHEKRKLYTFGNGEMIYDNEYLSSKKFGSNNWMMITQSPSGWKLVKNGAVKVSDAKWIDLLGYDVNGNKAVYAYKKSDDDIYVHIDGNDYGPFNGLWDFEGNLENPMSAAYKYRRMGIEFYRDYSGISYNLGDDAVVGDSRIRYSSLNGAHKLQFSEDKKAIIIDGVKIELLPSTRTKAEIYEVYVFDNGDWFVRGYSYDRDGGNGSYFSKGSVKGVVKDLSGTSTMVHPQKGFVGPDDAYNTDAMKKYKPLWYRPFGRKWNEAEQKLEVKTQFFINGKTPADEFISNWEYDYVLINNKKIGNEAAIDAWYDAALNAFVWITIEGNNLVENAYKL